MKTHLSHILPVWKACEIVGEPTVRRMTLSLLKLREHVSSNKPQVVEREIQVLVEALFYRPVDPSSLDTASTTTITEPSVPPHIAASWKRWLTAKPLALDKSTLLQFCVPQIVQPGSHGNTNSHMGLFDCLVYALQGRAVSSSSSSSSSTSSSYYGNASHNPSSANVIWLPDVFIFLAVCRQYQDYRQDLEYQLQKQQLRQANNNNSEDASSSNNTAATNNNNNTTVLSLQQQEQQRIVWTMALLAYRIYDSYLKKGTVARDTVHRFMTDIYGEDSYKKPHAVALLNVIFHHTTQNQQIAAGGDHPHASNNTDIATTTTTNPSISPSAVVTEQQFCKRCLDTVRPDTGKHLLLDWMAVLGNAMMPLCSIPVSVTQYLETSLAAPRQSLAQMYDLADHRLYEIKRRFHSQVQQQQLGSMNVIQGDPMNGDAENTATATNNNNNSNSHSTGASLTTRQHVITKAAFCRGVTCASEEMGTGGYLPDSLASLLFRAGTCSEQQNGWSLYNVLQFGGMAVRHDTTRPESNDDYFDEPLVRFLFRMFQQTDDSEDDDDDDDDNEADKRVLTRQQVTRMIYRLWEYAEFRMRADRSPLEEEDDAAAMTDNENADNDDLHGDSSQDIMVYKGEDTKVRLATNAALGLFPASMGAEGYIKLKELVDKMMQGTAVKDEITFEEFCFWNRTDERRRNRLAPIMLELRLIAAVHFGIPPTLASVEIALIAEIERRHKTRYPQSDVSRRGPRGTVWNIIDAEWFQEWANLVKKVSGTAEDAMDGRGDPRSDRGRGLVRISNNGLLENGSLSLRRDIHWKEDYEILPPLAWSALQAWYDGGPPIHRSVVKYIANSGSATSPHSMRGGMIPTENEIELYPYFVTVYLCDAASRGEARPFQQNFQLSRVNRILVMLVQLCRELDVDPDSARLWVMPNSNATGMSSSGRSDSPSPDDASRNEEWILSLDMNIVDQRKRRGVSSEGGNVTLLLELKDKETGLWPRGVDGREWAFRDKTAMDVIPSDVGDGVVGLYNMGNTCYLNSSIQCLSHTPILREYFTSKAYCSDVNTTNPLGHEGKLAQVSAVLINELWKRSHSVASHQPKRVTAPGSYSPLTSAPAVTPKTFKESLGKFNDIFAGNEQHDAQELLAFLLAGLSEDLNRIVEKPYIEAPDSDGRPDGELADIWWSNHLKREMSIIVALFTGQYKSLLTCRTCKYESARFEPFTFLQLPLPEDEHLSVSLNLYPATEVACPMRYCVRVRNDGKLYDVLVALAKVLHQDEMEEEGEVDGSVDIMRKESGVSFDTEDSKAVVDDIYHKRAQDLSVVVMREGYIARMAPNSWLLQDQQNKESGELPLLHVYELDPMDRSRTASSPDEKDESDMTMPATEGKEENEEGPESAETASEPSQIFVAVAQRRSELLSREFLHPLAHRVFGTPLLLRISDSDNFTNGDLYDLVARRLKPVVPKGALRFLSGQSKDAMNKETQSSSDDKSPAQQKKEEGVGSVATRTTTDMEEASAGPVPRYGFRLRVTSRDGRRCVRCPWYECCVGCLVPDNDAPTAVSDGESVVVDWHFAVDAATNGFGLKANTGDAIFANQPVSNRVRTPAVMIKNHSSCGKGPKKGTQPGAVTLEECLDSFAKEEKIPEAYCSKCKDLRVQTKRMSLWRLPPVMIIHLKRFQFTSHMRRKLRDLVVFPVEGLDLSRIMAPDSTAASVKPEKQNGTSNSSTETPSEDLKDDGRSEMLYDLYGVVHHQGALSGGHYVASLKSELDGQWRLFNDAQIYEIHARDVVDPSAYILFYIRRDVAKAQLSDYWDIKEGSGMSQEEVDQLLAKGRSDRCVIS